MESFEAAPALEERGTVHGADTYGGHVCNGSQGGSGYVCTCEYSICIPCSPDTYWCTQDWVETCQFLCPQTQAC